uniref:Capsid protein n=1 Tax=Marmot associated feces circular DNA molecule 1 TaxID=2800892 RepID=A0A7T7DFT9_9VIRU|nr:hypothetical protein [Marmot associated feces circular DNA molecule 1]
MDLSFYSGKSGFPGTTWRAGNNVTRTARPYPSFAADRINSYLGSRKTQRAAFTKLSRGKNAWRRSKLLTRNRSTRGAQIPSSGGESKSYSTLRNPKLNLGILKSLTGVNSCVNNLAGSVIAASGSQNVGSIAQYFNTNDILQAYTSLNQTAVGFNAAKLALLNAHGTQMYTNSCSSNTHMTIYDCLARYDGSDLNPSPVAVIQNYGTDTAGGVTSDYTMPGWTPFQNPRFTSHYRVVKQTPIVLSPGQTHCHYVNYDINKIINKERVLASDSAGPIGNYTWYTFIIIHGTPAHETAAETTVSTSLCKVDFVVMESWTFRASLLNGPSINVVDTLPVLTAGEQWVEDNPTDLPNAS